MKSGVNASVQPVCVLVCMRVCCRLTACKLLQVGHVEVVFARSPTAAVGYGTSTRSRNLILEVCRNLRLRL